MKNITNWLIALVVLGLIIWVVVAPKDSGKYDDFAKCIASPEKGVTFFGAFWCPHCQTQKKRFGSSQKYLPYVECSTVDGRSQLQVCKDVGITTYPTWEFATGTVATSTYRIVGEIELTDLAERTQCQLPQ